MKTGEYSNGKMILRDMTDAEVAEYKKLLLESIQTEPTQLDRIESQLMYTALITDTLIESEV